MSMEIKLTDIRGEPPLQVGEFILDKDNNVMYVGSGNFELSKCRGVVDIYAKAKAFLIPPYGKMVTLNMDYGHINASAKFIELPTITANSNINVEHGNINATGVFYNLKTIRASTSISTDIITIKGSGEIVT